MADMISDIKKELKEDRLVFGAEETIKGLRTGKFAKIYLAANCKKETEDDIRHHAGLAGVEVQETGLQNDELGDVCKQPFAIAVIGLKK